VPEASVIRGRQALSGFIGRKAFRRWIPASCFKASGLTGERGKRWGVWRQVGDVGIHGGAVKCVDIVKNTKGEGEHLGYV